MRGPARRTAGICFATACLVLLASRPAAAAEAATECPGPKIVTASGCTGFGEARREIHAIVHETMAKYGLRAALARVDLGNRTLARVATGNSMVGVPANLRMHLRIGSIAIPYVIDLLLQLQDKGRISLDDRLSSWFPEFPNADRITLRMLASSSSGYPDWIQENPAFVDALYANVFRQWTTEELLDIALARELICDPGVCFHYAHTNFIILGKIIKRVTGRSVGYLLHERVLRPLGLRQSSISALPKIPPPVLHAYTTDRGPYEDSTSWSPSWGIASDMLMTSTIGDIVKSAKALGSGALISKAAARERIEPVTAGLPIVPGSSSFSDSLYYGLGLLVMNGWQFQNPEQNGYTAIMAHLPSRRVSLGLAVTRHEAAADTGINYTQKLFQAITEYLTPDHTVSFPG